jgi:hypothetical protein
MSANIVALIAMRRGTALIDVIEFETNSRCTFAARIGKQPALAFVPYEAKGYSANAAHKGPEHESREKLGKVHGALLYIAKRAQIDYRFRCMRIV